MKIAWHWHLHQPPTQLPEIASQISTDCYRPLLRLLQDNHGLRVSVSISASLLAWWEQLGYQDLVAALRDLVGRGQVRIVGSGAFHPILTLLPEAEAGRQIRLEEAALSSLTETTSGLEGFFSPEMAISDNLLGLLGRLGYQWVLADEVSVASSSHFLQVGEYKTKVVVRDRGASLAVAFGHTQTLASFANLARHYARFRSQLILVMDGETFGHHWPGALAFLKEVVLSNEFEFVTISEILADQTFDHIAGVTGSTWGTSDADLATGRFYPKWRLPGNKLHDWQWELTDLAIGAVAAAARSGASTPNGLAPSGVSSLTPSPLRGDNNYHEPLRIAADSPSPAPGDTSRHKLLQPESQFEEARNLLDRALHSDQYWWASHNPYWNLEMVGRGGEMLVAAIRASRPVPPNDAEAATVCRRGTASASAPTDAVIRRAEELYDKIMASGKALYGNKITLS